MTRLGCCGYGAAWLPNRLRVGHDLALGCYLAEAQGRLRCRPRIETLYYVALDALVPDIHLALMAREERAHLIRRVVPLRSLIALIGNRI